MEHGYVQVYTGNGKGKTTAAFGLTLRAAGAGLRVFFAQFVKGMHCSELAALERFSDVVTVKQFGRGCFIRSTPCEDDIRCAREGLRAAYEAATSGEYNVVVLDEACIALHFRLFDEEDLLRLLRDRRPDVEVVITGRNAPLSVMDAADLVTEMKEVKHYYAAGVEARAGIEK